MQGMHENSTADPWNKNWAGAEVLAKMLAVRRFIWNYIISQKCHNNNEATGEEFLQVQIRK